MISFYHILKKTRPLAYYDQKKCDREMLKLLRQRYTEDAMKASSERHPVTDEMHFAGSIKEPHYAIGQLIVSGFHSFSKNGPHQLVFNPDGIINLDAPSFVHYKTFMRFYPGYHMAKIVPSYMAHHPDNSNQLLHVYSAFSVLFQAQPNTARSRATGNLIQSDCKASYDCKNWFMSANMRQLHLGKLWDDIRSYHQKAPRKLFKYQVFQSAYLINAAVERPYNFSSKSNVKKNGYSELIYNLHNMKARLKHAKRDTSEKKPCIIPDQKNLISTIKKLIALIQITEAH